MRILSLEIPDFKNLRNFKVDFAEHSPVAVIVGRNGSGKSNLLEALTLIFRDLDLAQQTAFSYRIAYVCRGRLVKIAHTEGASKDFRASVDGEPRSYRQMVGSTGAQYRPDHVFGYYSGPSNRLEEHFEAHQERFYRALLKDEDKPLRPLFYARNVHSNFVLLAFFLDNDELVQRLLHEHLGIESLDSILFVLQKPGWPGRDGDPRFWHARGAVSTFLSDLYGIALAPMRLRSRDARTHGRTATTERLYLYLAGLEEARRLLDRYERPQELFKALESTYISELIDEVRIRVKVRRSETTLTFRELSEGEQQLLLVLGLMRFTREEESLFLLDEPDTHLNPAWSVQYRQFLADFGGLDERSHVVMATHDPLVVAGLLKSEVRILSWSDSSRRVEANEPLENPRGMGVGALLTSDVYGLRSQLDLETLQLVDRKRDLASRESLDESQAAELDRLARRLHGLGLLEEDRDPEFQAYLSARREVDGVPDKPVFSRSEVIERRREAESLVSALIADAKQAIWDDES